MHQNLSLVLQNINTMLYIERERIKLECQLSGIYQNSSMVQESV